MSAFESVVEQEAIDQLRSQGFDYLPGADLLDERGRTTEVFLPGRLHRTLDRLNEGVPGDALDDAARRILNPATASVEDNNRRFHRDLTRGLEVEFLADGGTRGDLVWPVAWDDPDANDWLVTNQLTIRGAGSPRRPDLVLYLNGIPVAVFELKSPTEDDERASLHSAWKDLQEYKQAIPALFDTNEICAISDGVEARVGSFTSTYEWFGPWKSVEGELPNLQARSTLQRLLAGLFDRKRLLEYLRHYIFWDVREDRSSKKIAGYHQFYAVEKAVARTVDVAREGGDRRLGVIWHTQGSGKSVSMVFYAGKVIRQPELNNPTLLVLTDRLDLDDQLFAQFAGAKDLLPEAPVQAESREHLRRLLQVASGGIVFSTLHKLGTAKDEPMPTLTERDNVIVLADEAHRSHYEFEEGLAKNLDDALPNALKLGFTGTPIDFDDRSTPEVFGDYLDVYPMSQSVADGATVEILYEGRQNRVYAVPDLERLDRQAAKVLEGAPEAEKDRLLREEARLTSLLGKPEVLGPVAEDVVRHWEERQKILRGKAMIATHSREVAVLLYDRIRELRSEWHDADDARGKIKVIMTTGVGDPEMFDPHRRDRRQLKALEKRFKDPDDPLEMVILVDMWLTGFDVPAAHTLYLYKPMKGHTLMQAIARVNRVWGDKENGLIVDYVGLGEDLKRAVGEYGGYPGERVAVPVEEKLRLLQERFEVVDDMFHGFEIGRFFDVESGQRTRVLAAAVDHILALGRGKERYLDNMAELNAAAGMALHLEEARALRERVAFFQAVAVNIRKYGVSEKEEEKLTPNEREHYRRALQRVIAGTVASQGVVDIFEAAGLPRPDVSILSDEFLEAAKKSPYQNLQVEMLRKLLEDEVRAQRRTNVVQARKFSELLDQALTRYRNRSIHAAEVIVELIGIAKKMRETPGRGKKLGLSEDEVAFYDALADHADVREVMGDETLASIAQDLVDYIRRSVSIDWTQKEAVRAKMRAHIRKLLRRRGYPPDESPKAVETVLEQAEQRCKDWGEKGEDEIRVPARIVPDQHGAPMIAGANTKVVEIVAIRQAYAETPEEIAEGLPHLTVEQVEVALEYYEAHREEIDQDLERRIAHADLLREEMGQPELVERLRRRG